MKNLVKPVCAFALLFCLSYSLFSQVAIGDEAYGGIVFQVDKATGKGLVCSVKNLGTKYTWDDANLFCSNLEEGGFSDWRLPSEPELKLLYSNLQKTGKRNFGADFFWGQAQSAVNGWTMNFSQNGKPEPYTKTGHYKGKILPVREFTLQEVKNKYVIEMFGRRGELAFPNPIASKPTTAKIKLYGLTLSDVKTYDLINGSWTNGKFLADITGGSVTGISVTQPQIRLKFTSGTYGIIGVIGAKNSINSGSWSENGMSLVLGYDWNSGQNLLPKQNLPASNYATIVFDRQSFPDEKDQNKYGYGWWSEPKIRKTPTYKALALFWDGVQKELALYAFENDATLSNDPKILGKYKLRSYKYEEINTQLKEFITGYYYVKYPFPDLTALLLNDAMQLAPSTMLGISSGGHGSPESIMNGIISNGNSIKKCFTWVTELRKGPIDYFDFGTNCNTGSLYNLEPLTPFAKYVLASDLTRNSPSPSIGNRPDDRYDTYFKDPSKNAKDILSKMMDDYDVVYNDAAAATFYKSPEALLHGNTLSSWKQQLTLFDCSQFAAILNKLGGAGANDRIMERVKKTHPELLYSEESWKQADFKEAVVVCFPEYTSFSQDWSKFAIKQMDNRKGLKWDTDKPKGLLVKTF